MKTTLLAFICIAGLLGGCTAAQTTTLTANLTTIANSAQSDFTGVVNVANAATPPAPHVATCAQGGITVNAAMQKVLAATAGQTVGVFTAAAVASLYQPGSAQFQWVVTTLQTACIAEVTDLMQAGASTAGLPAAMLAVLAVAAPVK